jgi:hypothetical protein
MTAITRAHSYIHPEYGIGHNAVGEFMKKTKKSKRKLLEVALEDSSFNEFYEKKIK